MAQFQMRLFNGVAVAGAGTIESGVIDTRLISSLESVELKGSAALSDFKLEYRVGPTSVALNEYGDQPALLTNLAGLPAGATLDVYQPVPCVAPLGRFIQFRITNNRPVTADTVDAYLVCQDQAGDV